jgi:hypothetical protein
LRKKIAFSLIILLVIAGATVRFVEPASAAATGVIQNESVWIDSIGRLHIFGEVRNTGDSWLRFIGVTGTLYDSGGTVVDVIFTFTELGYLAPNMITPFDLVELDLAKSSRVQRYSLVLEYSGTSAFPVKLKIVNVGNSTNSLGWLEVAGEVENDGDSTSNETKVIGTFYDNAGKVVYVASTLTSPSKIPSGAKYGFKMIVTDEGLTRKVTRYSIAAESEEYTSVPELSWSLALFIVTLSLMIFAIRKCTPLKQAISTRSLVH